MRRVCLAAESNTFMPTYLRVTLLSFPRMNFKLFDLTPALIMLKLIKSCAQVKVGVHLKQKLEGEGCPGALSAFAKKKPILNGRYKYPDQAGAGITVFVLDTGIYWQNIDFAGRASFGWKAENQWSNLDAHGHGTHCASTAVGELYGVAKKANAVAVKVLGDNGSGSTAGVIAGVDWVPSQTNRGVASMSLGGGFSSALNAAVTQAVSQGVVVVVAAGNSNADACLYSPSSAPAATTVGSTTIGEKINGDSSDDRSSFSNFGTCVDIFAPGSLITAAWIGATDAFNTISGTSMACPHVSGAAALLLGAGNSPQQVKLLLQGDSSKDEIDFKCGGRQNCDRSPNYLLFNGCL